jgi:hypothetical protein
MAAGGNTNTTTASDLLNVLSRFYHSKSDEIRVVITRARPPNSWESVHMFFALIGLFLILRGVDLAVKHYHIQSTMR